MLRHYNTSQTQLGFLHSKVAEAHKTLKDALYTADTVSKDQDKKIKALEETVGNLNKSMDEMKKATEELKSSNEKEKEKCAAQERQNELLKAKVTMLEENVATERETLAQKVEYAEDKFTELAWYRMWVYNPNVDLDFLGSDREKLLEL